MQKGLFWADVEETKAALSKAGLLDEAIADLSEEGGPSFVPFNSFVDYFLYVSGYEHCLQHW
jgi:hypothetical protein